MRHFNCLRERSGGKQLLEPQIQPISYIVFGIARHCAILHRVPGFVVISGNAPVLMGHAMEHGRGPTGDRILKRLDEGRSVRRTSILCEGLRKTGMMAS